MAKTRRRRLIAGLAGAAALAGLAGAALAARHFGGSGSYDGDFGLPRRLPAGARDDLTWIHTAMEDETVPTPRTVPRRPRAQKRGQFIAPAPLDEPLPDGWWYNADGVPVNMG